MRACAVGTENGVKDVWRHPSCDLEHLCELWWGQLETIRSLVCLLGGGDGEEDLEDSGVFIQRTKSVRRGVVRGWYTS